MNTTRLVAAGLLSLTFGCGGGKTGEVLRPKDSTANAALDGPAASLIKACKPAAGEPLVVDLRSSERSDFEVAMQDGVAVVSYNCKELHLLKGCSVHGAAYVFRGVSRKEDIVQMESKDEVEANIPISGTKLSAGLKSGSTLELALITVGQKRTPMRGVHTEDLEGDCDGATHVIRGAYVGAFAMGTGTAGQATAVAEMFGVGAGGGSTSTRKSTAKDGDLLACRTSEAGATAPPEACQAIIRLDLMPLRLRGGPNPNKPPAEPPSDAVTAPEAPNDPVAEAAAPPPSAGASASSHGASGKPGKKPKPGTKPRPTKGGSATASAGAPPPHAASAAPPPPTSRAATPVEDDPVERPSCPEGFTWTGAMCKKK